MPASSETTIESEKCWGAVRIVTDTGARGCAHDCRAQSPYVFYCLIGAFGEVRMCVHRDTGAQRAVKVLRKSHMDEDEKKMLFNEINILRNLVSAAFLLSLKRDSCPRREPLVFNTSY